MRRLWLSAVSLSILLSSAGHVVAQSDSDGFPPPFPPFPRSTSFGDIKLWVAGDTNLDQDKVALTTGDAVFAFVDDKSAVAGETTVDRQVREEVINGDLAASLGGRSATALISFDCGHAETTVDQVMVYPGNNLGGGDPKRVTAAHWLAANTSLDLTDLAQVACSQRASARRGAGVRTARTAQAAALRGPADAAEPDTARLDTDASAPAGAAAEPPARLPVDAHAVWVQIGAFASSAIAEDKWRQLQAKQGDMTAGLSLRTETAPHGTATLHRALIGPFATRAQARDVCVRLKAHGESCIVR